MRQSQLFRRVCTSAGAGLGLLCAAMLTVADAGDEQLIRAARAESNAAIARHDVDGIIGAMDSDYQVTTSLGVFARGQEEERDVWTSMFASRDGLLYVRNTEAIELSADYPLAAETGRWTGTWQTDDGDVRTGGRYMAMWRKTDGRWKLRSELFVALYCEGRACP
ncbi:MAG: nuclear transport factor 2 family protein [Gammaproteobacteria bacterium]|nr:nuclear transport factor 2 family protein [Gammaproteobacteria bacterium]MDH4256358.1 nuclear transport factor 2 family protein [Gammaproteobacteria bacterium]MDH5309114.1 nuclear transport factor 2 family protein [Gammaproteobacteria bacterium]